MYLLADAMMSTQQELVFKTHPTLSVFHMMLYVNLCAAAFALGGKSTLDSLYTQFLMK